MTALLTGADKTAPPRLAHHINAATLWNLPEESVAPKDPTEQLETLIGLGVDAIQHPFPKMLPPSRLAIAGMGRVDSPGDAETLCKSHQDEGYLVSTVHVGTGLETDAEIDRLIGAIIDASQNTGYPLFVETHRATATQDIRRTLDMIERFPEVRFNADLSHWYTGHEMTYGDINAKFDAMAPVFERVRYMHGRIGTACCAQVALSDPQDPRDFVEHFREMWRRCMSGFLSTAAPGELLPFAPELLPYDLPLGDSVHTFYYARKLGTKPDATEESDRWWQAIYLWEMAEECARTVGIR